MTLSYSYTRELELLITNTLLPVYIKAMQSQGIENPTRDINPELLKQIGRVKVLPALLKPKENQT